MTDSIDVVLVGYGYAGRTFHAPLIGAVPGLRLAAVVSSDPGKVRADLSDAQVFPDLAQALRDPSLRLVVVASPNDSHAPLARQALVAGRHVVVDKPFTTTLADAVDLDADARARGLVLSVFHNRRWDGDFLAVQQVLRSGRLGTVVQMRSHFDRFRPQVRDRWRERPGAGGGLWFDLGPHLLDQALCLFGPPERLSLDRACQRPGASADDWFQAVLHYGTRRVLLEAGMLVAAPCPRFTLQGTAGSLTIDGLDAQESALKAGRRPGSADWSLPGQRACFYAGDAADGSVSAPVTEQVAAGDYRLYYAGIRDAIGSAAPLPVTATEAVTVMRLLDLGCESAASGGVLPVRL